VLAVEVLLRDRLDQRQRAIARVAEPVEQRLDPSTGR
jgi:hypothetical protein